MNQAYVAAKSLMMMIYVCCLGFSLASFAMLLYCKLVIPLQQFLPNHVYISELHDTHFTCHVEYGLSLSLECTR